MSRTVDKAKLTGLYFPRHFGNFSERMSDLPFLLRNVGRVCEVWIGWMQYSVPTCVADHGPCQHLRQRDQVCGH